MIALLFALALALHQMPPDSQQSENIARLKSEIEKLREVERKLVEEFDRVNSELEILRREIDRLNLELSKEELNSVESVASVVTSRTSLFEGPAVYTRFLGFISQDTPVNVFDYDANLGFYKIRFNDRFAYILRDCVADTPQLATLRNIGIARRNEERLREMEETAAQAAKKAEEWKAQQAEAERRRQEEIAEKERQAKLEAKRRAERETARRAALIQKYGPVIGKQIIEKKIWIGMTAEMARESWGKPETINRTVTPLSDQEQWVYGSTYLYFHNGILTSYQTRQRP